MKLQTKLSSFKKELRPLINRLGMDSALNIPDYVLANYLTEQFVFLEYIISNYKCPEDTIILDL